jgi:hypothetical protein
MKGGEATSPSTAVASGVVTGIRVLVVRVLHRALRAVMMASNRIRFTGSGLSRGIKNQPAHRRRVSVLARAHKAVCPDGRKCQDSVHRRKKKLQQFFFCILAQCKIRCFALMNNPYRHCSLNFMNTASKLRPHTITGRGTCPGVGLWVYFKIR